jgi:hypothetical protein
MVTERACRVPATAPIFAQHAADLPHPLLAMPNGNAPSGVITTHQRVGSWVFGSLLLIFYMLVFLLGPPVLADYKHQQLGLMSALLAGLFAFFIAGDILTKVTWTPSAGVELAVRATGGLGIAALVLFWWGVGGGPIDSSSRVAAHLRQQIDSTARTTTTDTTRRTGGVRTSASTRELAQTLAQNDPKYRDVAPLANRVVSAKALVTLPLHSKTSRQARPWRRILRCCSPHLVLA